MHSRFVTEDKLCFTVLDFEDDDIIDDNHDDDNADIDDNDIDGDDIDMKMLIMSF